MTARHPLLALLILAGCATAPEHTEERDVESELPTPEGASSPSDVSGGEAPPGTPCASPASAECEARTTPSPGTVPPVVPPPTPRPKPPPLDGRWPGPDAVATVDVANTFGQNLSGLFYQPAAGAVAARLWGVRNAPATLFRLVWNGSAWTPDARDGWSAGKALAVPGGAAPDSEDLVFPDPSSPNVYVVSERDGSGASRPSVQLFDTSATGSKLAATREWDLTADVPVVAPNAGFEAITFLPDAYLVSRAFRDETRAKAYAPADYPDHGAGLFMLGLEGDGGMYVFALDHAHGRASRVAVVASGWRAIMSLAHDRDTGAVWASCDNTCGNASKIFDIDTDATSPTYGRFIVRATFARPTTLPNVNNEGITFVPDAECKGGGRAFFWADDSATDDHAIRRDAIPCGRFFP